MNNSQPNNSAMDSKIKSGSLVGRIFSNHMILIILLLMVSIFSIYGDNFFSFDNLITVLRQVSIIGVCAAGLMFALVAGHIDLSIGACASLAGVLFAKLISTDQGIMMNPWIAMLIVLVASAIIGIIKGLLVTKTNMPALIATLGVATAIEGANYLITDNRPISNLDDTILWLGQGYLGPVPMPVVIFVLIIVIAGFIQGFTYIGRYIYATGSNTEAARLGGVKTDLVKISAYAVCTMLCAVAGFILATRLRTGTPTMGMQYQTRALTACAVGGISLAGGEGNIYNLIMGIMVIGVLTNGLTIMGVSDNWQLIAQGFILVFAVGMDYYRRTRKKTAKRLASA